MQRVPEPELMTDPAQAEAYASADFSEPHEAFVAHFAQRYPDFRAGRVLDLGCGTADITIRFARAYRGSHVEGLDAAAAMLEWARRAVADAQLEGRIQLIESWLDPARIPRGAYDAVICNSLLHHLADPALLWQTAVAAARPDAPVMVMDLARPGTPEAAQALVERHADGAPELMRRDFYNSLLAAYTVDEVAQQLRAGGLDDFALEPVSDRHWVAWRKPRR
jgi:SAM-dependent methyltransferase